MIAGPSIEAKRVGETKKEFAGRHDARHRFWKKLLSRAKPKTNLHSGVPTGTTYDIRTRAGKRGLSLRYVARPHDANVELYIDLGQDCRDQNKAVFDKFLKHENPIESGFGGPLGWEPLEAKRACRIRKDLDIGGYADKKKWPQIHETMIDAMIRLEKALRPFIKKL